MIPRGCRNDILADLVHGAGIALLCGVLSWPARAEVHLSTEVIAPVAAAPAEAQSAGENGTAAGLAAYQQGQFAEALVYWTAAAKAGDPAAALYIGLMNDLGHGVEQNAAEAYRWYLRAAEWGNAMAMLDVGLLYDNGRGVSEDRRAAAFWYKNAADHGIGRAAYDLGLLYRDGDGVPRNRRAAISAFRQAEREGVTAAREQLQELGAKTPRRRGRGHRRAVASAEPASPERTAPASVPPELAPAPLPAP